MAAKMMALRGLVLGLIAAADPPIPPGVHPGVMSQNCSAPTGAAVGNRFYWLPRGGNASGIASGAAGSGYIVLAGDGHDGQGPGVPTMCVDASGGKQHLKGYTCGSPGCTGCGNQWYRFDASDSSIRWDGGDGTGCLFQNDADGSPDHPEPFITMKLPCPAKVTDSAGQWSPPSRHTSSGGHGGSGGGHGPQHVPPAEISQGMSPEQDNVASLFET